MQIWVADMNAPGFAEACHQQARAIAASDPGQEIMQFVVSVYEWPEM